MNINASNLGQVGNDTNGLFSNVSLKTMSKEEFVEEMEKNSSKDEAATVDISKEGKVKLLDVLGSGGKIHLEMTEQQKEERDVKEKAFQAMIQPAGANKIVSSKDLQTYNDFSSVVKANDPELADKMNDLMTRIANREPGENFGKEFISLMSQAGKVYQNAKNGNGAPILNDYNIMIGATAADFRAERDEKAYYGLSQRAEDITKAYAKAYSDIVKGYEDGTRNAYAIDKDSESGYRLMTMEEELAELDKAYEKSTDNISAMVKQSDDIAKPWYLSIYQYEEDFALGGYRMELETSDSMQRSDYYEANLEDCKIDLDLEDTILDAEALLRKWGYEDYEYVAAKGLVDSPYGNSFEGHGYHLIFEKEIDGITCDVYENYYLKMAVDDEEDVVPTVIERIDLSYDESGMFRVIVEERYEIDEISGKVTSLLGVSEAEEIALKEIEVNFAKDGELEYLGDIYGMDSNFFQNGEDVNTVYIDLKYVPLMYGEDVIYAPVYLFTMCDDVDGYENHSYIIAAVSALDGVAFTPCFR